MSDPVRYITDDRGERMAVVLPIADYEKLLEDLEDLAVIAERLGQGQGRVGEQELQPELVERRPSMDGVRAKDDDDTANPASVTATCAAMPRASLGCIATIKGEHGQEIKAQIHALLNQQLFDRSPKHPRPTHSISG